MLIVVAGLVDLLRNRDILWTMWLCSGFNIGEEKICNTYGIEDRSLTYVNFLIFLLICNHLCGIWFLDFRF